MGSPAIQCGAQKKPNFGVINETKLKWVVGFFCAPTRRGALPPPSPPLGTRPHQNWVFFCAPVFGFFFARHLRLSEIGVFFARHPVETAIAARYLAVLTTGRRTRTPAETLELIAQPNSGAGRKEGFGRTIEEAALPSLHREPFCLALVVST